MGSVALSQQRAIVGRRGALGIVAVAIGLAVIAGYSANTYIAAEAEKVAAPIRDVWVAARDIAPGTLLTSADVTVSRSPIQNDMAAYYLTDAAAPPAGIATSALRQGQPILAGTLLPAESADTVSPLIPLTVDVGGSQRPTIGALNFPIGQLSVPPPPMREGDRVDVWAQPLTETGPGALVSVLENIEVIAFSPEGDGLIFALTREQLARFATLTNQGAPMILTLRSSRR